MEADYETFPVTRSMYDRTRLSSSGQLRTTIKPEHMARWEELTRAGIIGEYEYDPDRGYVVIAANAPRPMPAKARQAERKAPSTVHRNPEAAARYIAEVYGVPEPVPTEPDTTPPVRVPTHGTVTMYLMGDQCDACLAAGERYRANGGTVEPGTLR